MLSNRARSHCGQLADHGAKWSWRFPRSPSPDIPLRSQCRSLTIRHQEYLGLGANFSALRQTALPQRMTGWHNIVDGERHAATRKPEATRLVSCGRYRGRRHYLYRSATLHVLMIEA